MTQDDDHIISNTLEGALRWRSVRHHRAVVPRHGKSSVKSRAPRTAAWGGGYETPSSEFYLSWTPYM